MTRAEVEQDIIEMTGQVPPFFAAMTDSELEHEWTLFKEFQMPDTALSGLQKQLIGLGVAAATYCPYCTYFHKSAARMLGATDAQIEETIRMASETRKYSTYLHGLELDMDEFRRLTDEMGEYMQQHAPSEQTKAA